MVKLKIFVSGANDDMQPELNCVSKAVASVELAEGIRVEQAISRNESPSDVIIEQIAACSVYIGVFNHQYGRIIPDEHVSAAEFEFNRARELRKPMLVWIRELRNEERGLSKFDRQESFLRHVRDSLRYKRRESDDLDDLEGWVANALRAAYLESQLRAGLSIEKVLGERLSSDHWSEAIVMLAAINDRPADLLKWLSREVKRSNDWRRVLLVKRCWETSAVPDDAEAQAAVIDALLVGLATGIRNAKGVAYRGIDPHVRRLSIRALACIGAPAVERLVASLKVGLGVGAGAADALGMIGDAWAVKRLFASQEALLGLGAGAADALGMSDDARAVEPLIAALSDKADSDTRSSAATALGRFGDPRATAPLFAALSDEDEGVRWAAAGALGEIGDAEVVEPLIELLEAFLIGNPLVRGSDELKKLASYSLGEIGDERAVGPLIAELKYRRDPEVQSRAAEALGKISDERAVAPLVNALRDPEEDVRLSAAVALGKIGSRQALPELQRVAREDEGRYGEVAKAAQQAIHKVKNKRVFKKVSRCAEEPPITTLYKYVHPDRIDDVLKGKCLRFTQPFCLNDPFELFPTSDSYLRPFYGAVMLERVKSAHYARMLAYFEDLLGGRAHDYGLPAMAAHDLQDDDSDEVRAMRQATQEIFTQITSDQRRAMISRTAERINEHFGMLCLAERADNILMWSHYADSHRGFVLELDATSSFFDRRSFDDDPIRRVRKVQYQTGRPARALFDQKYWLRSKRTAREDLLDYLAGLFLLTKSSDWAYEQEWRMIVPLSLADNVDNKEIYLFPFDPRCLRSVILGRKISGDVRKRILEALDDPDYSHVELRNAHMDPQQFRMLIKDDELVLERKLLKDIEAFPGDGIQERLERLKVSGPRLYSAISSLSSRGLISSSTYDRSKQKKRILRLINNGCAF